MVEIKVSGVLGENRTVRDRSGHVATFWPAPDEAAAERNANLWAHGYPALLEAVQRFFGWTGDPAEPGERVVARRLPESYEAIRIALYDAMKACESPGPPRKTRREVIEGVLREDSWQANDHIADLAADIDKALAELDGAQP